MASKEYYRKQIADKRTKIIALRADIQKVKEKKKNRMDYLSRTIKTSSSASSKENYRKMKVSEGARFEGNINVLKKKIDAIKKEIDILKKSLDKAK
jgi:hypothetical protein